MSTSSFRQGYTGCKIEKYFVYKTRNLKLFLNLVFIFLNYTFGKMLLQFGMI